MHRDSRKAQSWRSAEQSRTRFPTRALQQMKLIQPLVIVFAFSTIALSGCGTPKPATPEPPPPPAASEDLNLEGAAKFLSEDLAKQLGPGERTLVIDPLLDKTSGQQTGASSQMEQAIK